MITAMRVAKAEKHPNADRLRVYEVEGASQETLQIVANLTHMHEVGDLVAVVHIGSTFTDGSFVKEITLRGLESHGVLFGNLEEPLHFLDEDVSALFTDQVELD